MPVDDAVVLADEIRALALDPALRRLWGDAARIKARRDFDDRAVIRTTLATYDWLLARSATGLATAS